MQDAAVRWPLTSATPGLGSNLGPCGLTRRYLAPTPKSPECRGTVNFIACTVGGSRDRPGQAAPDKAASWVSRRAGMMTLCSMAGYSLCAQVQEGPHIMGLIIALLVVWLAFVIVGFVAKALVWLALVGIVLFIATGIYGAFRSRASRTG